MRASENNTMLIFGVLVGCAGCGIRVMPSDTDTTPTDTALTDTAPPDTSTTEPTTAELARELITLIRDPAAYLLPQLPEDPDAPGAWEAFPQLPENPITGAKVALGYEIFYEPGLASEPLDDAFASSYSCATCHNPEAGFSSGSYLGRGIGEGTWGDLADRHFVVETPTVADLGPWNDTRLLNIGYRATRGGWQGEFDINLADGTDTYNEKPCELYDAGFTGIECYGYTSSYSHGFWQYAEQPSTSSILHRDSGHPAFPVYQALFEAAFPELSGPELITRRTSVLAVAAFIRTIVASDAPFQVFLREYEGVIDGTTDSPLSDAAIRGGIVFFGEGNCIQCHSGPGFTADRFANIGAAGFDPSDVLVGIPSVEHPGEDMPITEALAAYQPQFPPLVNQGRADVTLDEGDLGRYAIISVYGAGGPNITRFGHGATHHSLEDWIRHKVGGREGATMDEKIVSNLDPILDQDAQWLDEAQIADLLAFIREGLTDPLLVEKYGKPSHQSLAGLCTPNHDPESCAAYGLPYK